METPGALWARGGMTAIVDDAAAINAAMKKIAADEKRVSADTRDATPGKHKVSYNVGVDLGVVKEPSLPSYGPGGDPNNADEYAGDGGYMG